MMLRNVIISNVSACRNYRYARPLHGYSNTSSMATRIVPTTNATAGTHGHYCNHRYKSSITTTSTDNYYIDTHSSSSSFSLPQLWNPTPEHSALRESLRSFVQSEVEIQADEYNKSETFNINLFRRLGTNTDDGLGLLGLTVDEQYGGTNMDASAVALVHEELSYSDPALCLSYLAHTILLGHNLYMNGSKEQREAYLPHVCSGSYIGGMGMSESNAGTDVLGMQTKAVPSTDTARPKNGWILNGTKMWITNGTLDGVSTGDIFLVYARTGPGKLDITQFLVTKGMTGFTLGQKIQDKLGMRSSMTAELVFDNVFIPAENIVGQVNQASICMMRNLEIERIALAAMGLGIARRCLDEMISYSANRTAFGARNLFEFGQIQRLIAESYAEYMAGRSYVYATANALQLHSTGNTLDADGTKLFCAAMSKNIADRAIQVLGGNGYIGAYKVERFWRDAKLLEIGGGTNESHHKNIIRDLRKMNRRLD
jgi:isovaleryl-CoA dehydrogenase